MRVNPNIPLWREDTVEIMGLRLWIAGWRAGRERMGADSDELHAEAEAMTVTAQAATVSMLSTFTPGNEAEQLAVAQTIVQVLEALDPDRRNDMLRSVLLDLLVEKLS